MNLLFDTNVIIHIIRAVRFNELVRFLNPHDLPVYISVVSEAEIKSLALQNKWGLKRLNMLDVFLDKVNIVGINQSYVNVYSEIDAYSQRLHTGFSTYPFETPRNMGKNDLWVASLATLLSLELVTTDKDFNHLNQVFLSLRHIDPTELKSF
jgi:tRNA(fMet)-specific endonuclease VapC